MDKKKLMMEFFGVFEENENLTKRVAELEAELAKKHKGERTFEDLEIAGRKCLFEQVKSYRFDYGYDIKTRDGKLLTLSEWLDTLDWEIFSPGYCTDLNNHSLKELIGYFMDELTEIYNAKLYKLEASAEEKASI